MADHFSIYCALDDVAPGSRKLRAGWASDLKALRGPGAKARGAPHLELAANELPHVPTIGVPNVDAEAHLAVRETPRHIDADSDSEWCRRLTRELRHGEPIPASTQQVELAAHDLGPVGNQKVVQADLVRVAHRLTSRALRNTLYDTSYSDC
jgi:hypothetical protein